MAAAVASFFYQRKCLFPHGQNAGVLLVCPSSPQSGASPRGEADGEAHILGKIKIIGILFSKRRFSVDKVRFLCYFVSVIGHKRIFANIGLNMKAQTFLPHTGKVATIGGIA